MVKVRKKMSGVIHKVEVWVNSHLPKHRIQNVMHICGLKYQVNQMVNVMVVRKQESFGENKQKSWLKIKNKKFGYIK